VCWKRCGGAGYVAGDLAVAFFVKIAAGKLPAGDTFELKIFKRRRKPSLA
jgi:hypothetical protein